MAALLLVRRKFADQFQAREPGYRLAGLGVARDVDPPGPSQEGQVDEQQDEEGDAHGRILDQLLTYGSIAPPHLGATSTFPRSWPLSPGAHLLRGFLLPSRFAGAFG